MTILAPYSAMALTAMHFVRTRLAGATAAQLEFARILPIERDKFLEKPIRISLDADKDSEAAFLPFDSRNVGASCIAFKPQGDRKMETPFDITVATLDLVDLAAHESLHAVKFWNDESYYCQGIPERNLNAKGLFMMGGGAIGVFGGLLARSPATMIGGVALFGIGLSYARKNSAAHLLATAVNKEELDAFRLGNIFDPKTYDSNFILPEPQKGDSTRPANTLRGYPNGKERLEMHKRLMKECMQAAPATQFFPGGTDDFFAQFEECVRSFENDGSIILNLTAAPELIPCV